MGSGTSRGKRVAPACASDVTVAKTDTGTSPKRVNRPFKSSKINAMLRNARNRAHPDCHSEGHDSDFSREDDNIDGEMNTVLADYEKRGWASAKESPPKKTAVRSRTYGLCHSSQEEQDSGSEEPRGSKVVNKRSDDAFQHLKKHTPASPSPLSSSSRGFLKRGVLSEAVPTPDKQSTFGSCYSTSVTMPVILYDGAEEELMDTIEREFS